MMMFQILSLSPASVANRRHTQLLDSNRKSALNRLKIEEMGVPCDIHPLRGDISGNEGGISHPVPVVNYVLPSPRGCARFSHGYQYS